MIYFQITDLDTFLFYVWFCAVSLSRFGSPQPVNLTVDLGTFQCVFVLEEHLATIAALRAPGVSPCSGHTLTASALCSKWQQHPWGRLYLFIFLLLLRDSDTIQCWKEKNHTTPSETKRTWVPVQSISSQLKWVLKVLTVFGSMFYFWLHLTDCLQFGLWIKELRRPHPEWKSSLICKPFNCDSCFDTDAINCSN